MDKKIYIYFYMTGIPEYSPHGNDSVVTLLERKFFFDTEREKKKFVDETKLMIKSHFENEENVSGRIVLFNSIIFTKAFIGFNISMIDEKEEEQL